MRLVILVLFLILLSTPAFAWPKPSDYGATGNCTTDDTGAFNSWLAAGKHLELDCPATCYRTTATLSIPSDTIIEGVGCVLPEIQFHGTNGHAISIYQKSNVIIRNVKINGRKDLKSTYGNAITINNSLHVTLDGVAAVNAKSSGIGLLADNQYIRISGPWLADNDAHGMTVEDTEDSQFTGIMGEDNAEFVIHLGDGAIHNIVSIASTGGNGKELFVAGENAHHNALGLFSAQGNGDNGSTLVGDKNAFAIGAFSGNDNNGFAVVGGKNIFGMVSAHDNDKAMGGYADVRINHELSSDGDGNVLVGASADYVDVKVNADNNRIVGISVVPTDSGSGTKIGDYVSK